MEEAKYEVNTLLKNPILTKKEVGTEAVEAPSGCKSHAHLSVTQ